MYVCMYLFIYLSIQYLKKCTLLAEIAILPSGPLVRISSWQSVKWYQVISSLGEMKWLIYQMQVSMNY